MMGKPPTDIFGISDKALATMCRVSLKTAQRWKRGQSVPPESALMIVRRDLGCFAAEWAGWTINGPDLVSPHGWCVDRNDALIVPLLHSQISALKAQVADLEATRDALEDQPEPGAYPDSITA